jgi:hypothetical protein
MAALDVGNGPVEGHENRPMVSRSSPRRQHFLPAQRSTVDVFTRISCFSPHYNDRLRHYPLQR